MNMSEMTVEQKQELAKQLLTSSIKQIDNGTCGVNLDNLIDFLTPITRVEMNAEQVCEHYHISRATLTRWISDEKIPKPHTYPGGKHNSRVFWYSDELPNKV